MGGDTGKRTRRQVFFDFVWGKNIYQKILRAYLCIALIGTIFLSLPISRQPGKIPSTWDASLFISISAFTNTGLTVCNISDTFNLFGQFVILLLIQAGGMGLLTIFIFVWSWIKRKNKYSVEHRLWLDFERGSSSKLESFDSVKTGITALLIVELVGAFLLTAFFFFAQPKANGTSASPKNIQGNFGNSVWMGVFHSVSAANNAGFDLLGSKSIQPYNTGYRNILSVIFCIQSIMGGIGYPIFYELRCYLKNRRQQKFTPFSLAFKINIISYFFILFAGALLACIFEASPKDSSALSHMSEADRMWNVIYLSFSSRSSGFSGMDISSLKESTRWLLSSLMFIGANPSSTGGGVRSIVIFIIVSRMWYTMKGKRHLSPFKKTIKPEIVDASFRVLVLSAILVSSAVFLILLSDPTSQISNAIFEASSAFGTAGLTSGLTEKTNWFGRLVLVFVMFVGQLGVSNALISITDVKSLKRGDVEYDSPNLKLM